MPDITPIEYILSGAVTSLAGAVVWLWKQQVAMHVQQIKWRDDRIENLEKSEAENKKKIEELQHEVTSLRLEAESLKTRFIIFQSTHDSAPIPMWIKDNNGRVLSANKAYEDLFLKPRGYTLMDYVNKDDFSVWPKDIADEFRLNDQRVHKDGKVWDGEETVVNEAGVRYQCRIIKYPRYMAGINEPFGIAGVAVPEKLLT